MAKLTEMLFNLIASVEIKHNRLSRKFIDTAKTIRLKIHGLPGIVQYKALGSLKLLNEASTILTSLDMVHFVVGGFAFDIRKGQISRSHGDIDIAVLYDGNADRMGECFRHHGYTVNQGIGTADYRFTKYERSVDLFSWHKADDGSVFKRHGNTMVRMPMDCFSYEIKSLFGNKYRIASDEYNVCIEPFVQNVNSKEYISSLKQKLSTITCKQSVKEVFQSIDIYEFSCSQHECINASSNSLDRKRISESCKAFLST